MFCFSLVFPPAHILHSLPLSEVIITERQRGMNETVGEIRGGLERRKTSRFWYGRFQIDGERKVKNLHVEVRGTPPGRNEEHGSVQFEKSKSEAEAALKTLLAEMNSNKTAEDLAQAVHEVRTGRKVGTPYTQDLAELWNKLPRSKPVSASHKKKSLGWINSFIDWMDKNHPKTKRLDQIGEEHALAFMQQQEQRGITAKTWNSILSTLKTACRRGGCTAFNDIRQRPLETIHRIPFTPDELQAVLQAAKPDELIYPLVVTATCTAMRKGDCCRIRWKDVDLESGFITVKTSKTSRTVDIPLADLLRSEIEKQVGNESEYVFPKLAKRYTTDDTYLTKRFKKILAMAGFHDGTPPPATIAPYDPSELANRADRYFNDIPTDQKREKARDVFNRYISGTKLCTSAKQAGVSKGTASAYLNEIEAATGIAFIRGKTRAGKALPQSRGNVRQDRKTGLRRASVRDFHALRTTWITLALMQGMPLELVKTVTGHATAEIVMEHYFKPQREQLKTAIQKCLPSILSTSSRHQKPAPQWIIDLIQNMTPENCEKVRKQILNNLS